MGLLRCNFRINRNMDRGNTIKHNNMKTLILLLLSSTATAQSVHYDTALARSYVNVSPVSVPPYLRTVSSITRLYARLTDDNLYSSGVFNYELRGLSENGYVIVASGSYNISGSDYTNWNANDNMAAFQFVASQSDLSLTIIE